MEKTLTQVQEEVDIWANQFEKPYFSPLSMVATMAEEVGEVARIVNTLYGDKRPKKDENLTISDLEEELGDALFTIVCLANEEGISLESAFERKLDKIYGRDNDRFEKKSYRKNIL